MVSRTVRRMDAGLPPKFLFIISSKGRKQKKGEARLQTEEAAAAGGARHRWWFDHLPVRFFLPSSSSSSPPAPFRGA